MDCHADVILAHKFVDARKRLQRRVTRDDHIDAGPLAVFELTSNVSVFILRKINSPGGMKMDTGRREEVHEAEDPQQARRAPRAAFTE